VAAVKVLVAGAPGFVGRRLCAALAETSPDVAAMTRKDAAAATAFGQAGARAGLQRIIYLGGLGDDQDALSAHLRRRRELEKLLGRTTTPPQPGTPLAPA
jgi:uncharacterized protein YbjT (DUF2867 family)